MRNWTGLMLFVIGAWFVYSGLAQRHRVRLARQAVNQDEREAASVHPSLAMLGDIFPPIIIAGLALVGLKVTLLYILLEGDRVFSLLDLAGFLFLLVAYGTWLALKTKYREVRTANARSAPAIDAPVAAPGDEEVAQGDSSSERAAGADAVRVASL